MITFEQFVESLGDYAKQYTPEQLQHLHMDVRRFAQVVIAIYRAKERAQKSGSQQSRVDDRPADRTLKKTPPSP